jgi:hypothetical protein
MVEIHPTIEIHKRFPPSTPQYSPIDLCYTSEIYFYPQNFIPNWCCHIRILNNIHSMEVHPMGSDSHINIHFIRWMKSIHHGCRLILHHSFTDLHFIYYSCIRSTSCDGNMDGLLLKNLPFVMIKTSS